MKVRSVVFFSVHRHFLCTHKTSQQTKTALPQGRKSSRQSHLARCFGESANYVYVTEILHPTREQNDGVAARASLWETATHLERKTKPNTLRFRVVGSCQEGRKTQREQRSSLIVGDRGAGEWGLKWRDKRKTLKREQEDTNGEEKAKGGGASCKIYS